MPSRSTQTVDLSHCVIENRWYGDTLVINCRGVLDMLTAQILERHTDSILTDKPAAVIIDLTDIEFLASRGMAVLIATNDQVSPHLPFAVVADGPITSRPMKLVGLDELMPMRATLDLALEHVRSVKHGALA